MSTLPARRIARRVGRRSLRHLVEQRGPQLDLRMPEQRPGRSRRRAARALGALYA